MKKIIVNGFQHTGTTILRKIIGDHPDVYDTEMEIYDMKALKEVDGYSHAVCKFVGLPVQLYPYDVTRIWLIKNPWDVFGSIIRRLGTSWKTAPNYALKDYLYYIERWVTEDLEGVDIVLRYEDLWRDPYIWVKIHQGCGLTPMGLIPGQRRAGMGSGAEIPTEEPPRHMIMDFRTWQINQPLEDKTYQSAPWCPLEILKKLGDYPIIQDAGYAMTKVEGLWFPVGAKLTSKENGQLIIAAPGTAPELIVGTVTKEGFDIK